MGKRESLRRCIGCKEAHEKKSLVRFVISPSNDAVLDYSSKLPGRGCYLCPDRNCIEKSIKSKAFQRAFKCNVNVGSAEDIIEATLERVRRKVSYFIALAVRCKKASLGTMAVEKDMKKGRLCLLLLMSGISVKMKEKWKRSATKEGVCCKDIYSISEVESIIGNRRVLGIGDPGISGALIQELERVDKLSLSLPYTGGGE